MFMAFQLAGANAKETNDRFTAELEKISKTLPDGLHFQQMMSTNDFLLESIANVEETLIIAIFLVILVVYFFLQDFKATLIPAISIIISLVGTFAALAAAGFTLNLLTLFALVLAIGTVVDDAIVVVEAVQARLEKGERSEVRGKMTEEAMHSITSALITTTLVFMAVFVPVCFIGGVTGTFYTQFGLTMAIAVGISLFNALTLSPALCALIMKPNDMSSSSKGFHGRFNAGFTALLDRYKRAVSAVIPRRWLAVAFVVLAIIFSIVFSSRLKKRGERMTKTFIENLTEREK